MKKTILSLLILLGLTYSCSKDEPVNLDNLIDTLKVSVKDTIRDTITHIVSQDSLDYVKAGSPILLLKVKPYKHPFVTEFDVFVDGARLFCNVPFGVDLSKVKYTVQPTPKAKLAGFDPVENNQFVNLSNASHTFYFKKKFIVYGFKYTLDFKKSALQKPTNPLDSVIIRAIDNNTLSQDIKVDISTGNIWKLKLDQRITRETTFKATLYAKNKVKEIQPSSEQDIDFSKPNFVLKVKFLDDEIVEKTVALDVDLTEVVDLIFEVNGGDIMASRQYLKGVIPSKPSDPTRSGYTFDGWYKDKGLTTKFDFTKHLTKTTIIYAKWTSGA